MDSSVVINVLPDGGDVRGSSFSLPHTWLGKVDGAVDAHISSLVPGEPAVTTTTSRVVSSSS
ncbi:hypothetical protein [Embleya scabrispora]|uniref:hypothetical protein n=1 Tax=Embleya scabrispora TaxID=159449 RepID=UPI0003A63DC9|nr:hypothetical protein [Embleya scabrispora]MYS81569.1 hypothetical protein [Streptomyces sp. SID5474]